MSQSLKSPGAGAASRKNEYIKNKIYIHRRQRKEEAKKERKGHYKWSFVRGNSGASFILLERSLWQFLGSDILAVRLDIYWWTFFGRCSHGAFRSASTGGRISHLDYFLLVLTEWKKCWLRLSSKQMEKRDFRRFFSFVFLLFSLGCRDGFSFWIFSFFFVLWTHDVPRQDLCSALI